MKILFSPSETKTKITTAPPLNHGSFIFPSLYAKRCSILNRYKDLLCSQKMSCLQEIFGTKDAKKCLAFAQDDIVSSLTCKAIQRYSGIAYQHLDYASLPENEKTFLDTNVIIFSNLLGPLRAGDFIPYYKLQQGATLDGFKPEWFFKTSFSQALDALLENEFIVDLRAGFYEKFYTLKQPYVTMKFLKNGKVISHFAKAYRGAVLRQLCIHKPQHIDEFTAIPFENLKIIEILKTKIKSEYVFEIIA